MSRDKNARRARWVKRIGNSSTTHIVSHGNVVLFHGDCRTLLRTFPEEFVDCIITSPPYASLKDYGSGSQIGFGQHLKQEFLPQLEAVFLELFRIARLGAAFWLVIDDIKVRDGLVLLTSELATRAGNAGWTVYDVVTWDKGRSLPWSHPGRFRSVCENIVLLGKGKLARFELNAAREHDYLSPYWVKYPERYHPHGKAPSDLWHFPIPTQGSWAKSQPRHFCPFPLSLVARMLGISTQAGDIVLDPFAGTGSVLAAANFLGRKAVGIEVNKKYFDRFKTTGFDALTRAARKEIQSVPQRGNGLDATISKLRILKFPRTLSIELSRVDRLSSALKKEIMGFVLDSVVIANGKNGRSQNVVAAGHLIVVVRQQKSVKRLSALISKCCSVPPLSKFGVNVRVSVLTIKKLQSRLRTWTRQGGRWHEVTGGRFFWYRKQLPKSKTESYLELASQSGKYPAVLSSIGLRVELPQTEYRNDPTRIAPKKGRGIAPRPLKSQT